VPKASFHRAPPTNGYYVKTSSWEDVMLLNTWGAEALPMLAGLGVGWGNTTISSYA
jgi:hypothetical protein